MSIRRAVLRLPLRQLRGSTERAASSLTRVAAHDSQPLRHIAPASEQSPSDERHSDQRQPSAKRQNEPAGLAPLPLPFAHSQTTVPNESYFVQRTPTRNLPVYQLRKRGGNLKQTRVRKISGKAAELLDELEGVLKPKPEWLRINPVTGHIEMKGWYKDQIDGFLQAKGF